MAAITYKRTYAHQDWIDNADIVQAGGERGFNIEFHGLEAEFDTLSGVVTQINSGLNFTAVGAGGAVAYAGGNVGIGTGFSAASPPTFSLEVNLGDNTAQSQQVRFGNAICCNGNAGGFSGYAVFAHRSHAFDSDYALRQGPNGNVNLNAAAGQPVSIRQNGTVIRLGISAAGNVVVGNESDLPGANTAILQVAGEAFKLTPGQTAWQTPSDARLKEDVRDLDVGLAELRQVRPVRFRCNGRAGTKAGQQGIGILGQEIEKIFPEMIRRVPGKVVGEVDLEDLRIYDGSALTYVLVNAVKELAGKVELLEQALAENRSEHGPTGQPSRPR